MKTPFSFLASAGLAAVILLGCGNKWHPSGKQGSGGITASGGSPGGGQSADLTPPTGGDTGGGTPTGGGAGATDQGDAATGAGGDSSSTGGGSTAGGAPFSGGAGATGQEDAATGAGGDSSSSAGGGSMAGSAPTSGGAGVSGQGGAATGGTDGGGAGGASDAWLGTFKQVDAGDDGFACGVRTDGTIACWGDNRYGQTNAPTGTFSEVSAGSSRACGVRTDGTIACWGSSSSGETNAPTGTFSHVSAANGNTCALTDDGTALCWGALVVCVPGTNGCASAKQLSVCSSRGNSWVADATCDGQTCVAGSCVGECAPNFVSCDGASATTCTADGHKTTKSCDYGCVQNSGCASSLNTCTTECNWKVCESSCDGFTGICTPTTCTCKGSYITTCVPRSCSTAGDCGTLGYCDTSASGGAVCRALGTSGTSTSTTTNTATRTSTASATNTTTFSNTATLTNTATFTRPDGGMLPNADAGSCPAVPPASGSACASPSAICSYGGTGACFCSGASSSWLCTVPPERG